MAYVRTVKTSSGAMAVQVVWSSRRGSLQSGHPGLVMRRTQMLDPARVTPDRASGFGA
ncbi:hypothetical protein MAHJHV51_56470 [Mycobacterium avium subsp. hominissuis]